MLFKIAAFVLAALTALAAVFVGRIPFFKERSLAAKMLCSFGFLLTGVCASAAVDFTPYTAFMLGGLALGVLGDFFLDYRNGQYFLWGALFFGAGHILYILNFVLNCSPDMLTSPYIKQMSGVVLLMVIMSIVVLLLNKIRFSGKYRPMALYAFVLLQSFIIAFTRGMVSLINGQTEFALCLLGASVLFLTSDTSLAISMFGTPPREFFKRMAASLIGPTYFPAQALFALSIIFAG